MSTSTAPRTDVYARVTETIIASLEEVRRPWHQPWTDTAPGSNPLDLPLRHNGMPYRGVNVLLLWVAAIQKGYRSPSWMTYKQAQSLGAHVRKGETGSFIVYADRITRTETDARGEDVEREIAFMKSYTVFNVEQIEGLPEQHRPMQSPTPSPVERLAIAEQFFAATGARFEHGGKRAYYSPSADVIRLPHAEAFRDAESYASTKGHELIHWTGHTTRLAREFGKRFGDNAYAFEELVAELGAAFLCAMLGVTPEVQPEHADYLAHWLAILKTDKRAIFTAAAQAQRAADYLHALQPSRDAEQEMQAAA